jgi:hypothetical protein
MSTDYEELSTGGNYAKWDAIGDTVEGRIGSFSLDGGTDFNDNPCPQLVVETVGGTVIVNGGQASLKRAFTQNASRLVAGHGVKVTYAGTYETPKGEGKSFTLGVTPKPIAPIVVELADDEAPF